MENQEVVKNPWKDFVDMCKFFAVSLGGTIVLALLMYVYSFLLYIAIFAALGTAMLGLFCLVFFVQFLWYKIKGD